MTKNYKVITISPYLYIVSDKDIKEGNYYNSLTNTILQCKKNNLIVNSENCKKVITSTNPELNLPLFELPSEEEREKAFNENVMETNTLYYDKDLGEKYYNQLLKFAKQ